MTTRQKQEKVLKKVRSEMRWEMKEKNIVKYQNQKSRFRCCIDRIVAFLGTDQVVLNGALKHLHDPILSIPPSIRAHDAHAIRDLLQRRSLSPSQVRDGYQPALARKLVRLRDRAPIHVTLLLRRGSHRA